MNERNAAELYFRCSLGCFSAVPVHFFNFLTGNSHLEESVVHVSSDAGTDISVMVIQSWDFFPSLLDVY